MNTLTKYNINSLTIQQVMLSLQGFVLKIDKFEAALVNYRTRFSSISLIEKGVLFIYRNQREQ